MPSALITGITGQDGSHMADLLIQKGYEVHGIVRRSSNPNHERIAQIAKSPRLILHQADLTDQHSLTDIVGTVKPAEIYNFAAQSFVPASWTQPIHTGDVTGLGVVRMLEAIRYASPKSRFYQASSSEMFGNAAESPQSELTRFRPRSPYGAAKVYGHHATVNYRESFGLFAVSGILFNHEGERRGPEFVTRKVTAGAVQVKLGYLKSLQLGNLTAQRDWGYAPDYMRAVWEMLQMTVPDDYVIATGVTHSVEDLCQAAFGPLNLDWRDHVRTDSSQHRPAEVYALCGDASKAYVELGWRPTTSFETMIRRMLWWEYARLHRLDDLPDLLRESGP